MKIYINFKLLSSIQKTNEQLKKLANLISDHLSLNNSLKISTPNMMIMYQKIETKSIKQIQIEKVNILLHSFPVISNPVVFQEVIEA